jgi:localization factor PodJL
MKLSEWLDDAIAERAAEQGVEPEDFDREDRLEAIAERLAHLERRSESSERRRRGDEDDDERQLRQSPSREETKRADEMLEEAIAKLGDRTAENEKRAQRALDTVADWIEQREGGARAERRALEAIAERLDSIEKRVTDREQRREAVARAPDLQRSAALSTEEAARELDTRMNELALRIEAAEKERVEALRPRQRVDFAQAVSEIARRRQALDRARGLPAAPRPPAAGSGSDSAGLESPPPAQAPEAPASPREEASVELRADLQRLGLRLEEIVRDQAAAREAPQADVSALRAELSAMSRVLTDLAPRNAVAGIEGAVRDLSQRVASLQDRALRESLAQPVDEIVSAIRETLRAHDPREAVANLDRDIHAIARKVDTLAGSQIDPEVFERIRRQTEDVRNMLTAAATRPMPVDRLEKQIGELADRIDRLTASRSPNVDSARVLASLAQTHEQIERSTPSAALGLIERRLEAIAGKMDQAIARSQAVTAIAPKAVEELARRIESVRQTIETRQPTPIASASLEAGMRELSAKLEETQAASPHPQALEAWMRDVSAKLQDMQGARREPDKLEAWMSDVTAKLQDMQADRLDPAALEAWMREIAARLRETQAARQDPRSLEAWMREVSATLQETQAARADPEALRAWMREVSGKLQETLAARADPEPLITWMRDISAKLETARPVALDTEPLERWMRELTEKLDRAPPPVDSALETMIRGLEEKLDRPAPSIDSTAFESLVRGLEDKLDRARVSERDLNGLAALQGQVARIDERLARSDTDPSSASAVGRMVAQLSAQLEETREALRNIPALVEGAAHDEMAERRIDTLRATQEASERRVQSTLSGVHAMLERLVDRMTRLEDEVVRAGEPAAAESVSAAGAVPLSEVEPAKRDQGPPSAGERAPARAPILSSPKLGDRSDFLIEPGAGAPPRALEREGAAPPKSAINAHIAAARRAAQAAIAENAAGAPPENAAAEAAPAAANPLAQAQAYLNARRRPILLGLAFVILGAIAVVGIGSRFQSGNQKMEVVAPPAKSSTEPTPAPAPPGKSSSEPALAPPKNDARAVDMTPTGSIAVAPPADLARKSPTPAPVDLVSLIPSGAPQALRDLAAAGDPAAEYELAARLAEGRNVPRDFHAASQWFERAALQNFAPAEYRLGNLYEKGNGVERDLALAKAWYQKSADSGNIRAMHNLAVLAAENSSSKPDYADAFNWFQKAARFGVKDSQYNLAILYARGLGVAQDLSQSWFWFSLAAQQGDADAAKKRDEIALKLDANAMAAAAASLAAFHPLQADPTANEVKAPDGGWDAARAPVQGSDAAHKAGRVTPL